MIRGWLNLGIALAVIVVFAGVFGLIITVIINSIVGG